MRKRFALISVYNKNKITDVAKALHVKGIEIITTEGTGKVLKKDNIQFIPIEKITSNPERFDGRIKTISFQTLSGILFDRGKRNHSQDARTLGIPQIDFVVCNFYPFDEKSGIEMIDIGGPTMVRAAAKNYASVTVLVDPKDYTTVIEELHKSGDTSVSTRKELARKAFQYVLDYDSEISNYFQQGNHISHVIIMSKGKKLRYGENPHQRGYFFQNPDEDDPLSLGRFRILQGKEPSFNNYLDVSAGLETIMLIGKERSACVIIKHVNPCGAAIGENLKDAFQKAWFEGDPLAAFGGVILFNRPVNGALAKTMLSDKKFFEIIAAPSFDKRQLHFFHKNKNSNFGKMRVSVSQGS